MYASSLSTYPRVGLSNVRQGDPICDQYRAEMFRNRCHFALADGCNWGARPLEAAVRAADSFMDHLRNSLYNMNSVTAIKKETLHALSSAHLAIIEGKRDPTDAGQTTLVGGVMFELEPERYKCQNIEVLHSFINSYSKRG